MKVFVLIVFEIFENFEISLPSNGVSLHLRLNSIAFCLHTIHYNKTLFQCLIVEIPKFAEKDYVFLILSIFLKK